MKIKIRNIYYLFKEKPIKSFITKIPIMNQKDFKGIYKWKFLIPSMYIISWLLMIFGPLFFPYGYQIYCIIIVVYSLLKTLGLALGTFVAMIVQEKTLKILQKRKEEAQANKAINGIIHRQTQIYHAIIIPSYKEDQQVLLETLGVLAKNQYAKTQFIILLAMEAHQKNSDQKAKSIINKSKQNFLFMGFTQHVVRQNQYKGKASNVSWCAEHLEQTIPQRLNINLDKTMITIVDADSWIPVEYFQKIQLQLEKRPEIIHRSMYCVPQIYTRNHLDVPVFNRTYDIMHSIAHVANLVGIRYLFPLSNYSLSYNLAKKIQWWDTCADAIGEDFHTCQKCYWKLENQSFITVPIFIPCNQVSLSTGQGYISDLKARFWQAQRHTLGVSDVAYSWNMLFKTPFKFRNLILTFIVTQVFAMAAVIPWAILALGIQYKLVNNQNIHFFPMWVIDLLLNITPIFTASSYIFYQRWKRVANKRVWGKENDKLWRVIQYPLNFMVALFGMSVPAFLMASFAVLCKQTQYRVAEKRLDKNKPIQSQNNLKLNIPVPGDKKQQENTNKKQKQDEKQNQKQNQQNIKISSYQNLRQTPKAPQQQSQGYELDQLQIELQVSEATEDNKQIEKKKSQQRQIQGQRKYNNMDYESGKTFITQKKL